MNPFGPIWINLDPFGHVWTYLDLYSRISKKGEECVIPTPGNTNTFAQTVRVEKEKIMTVAKKKVSDIFKKKSQEKASTMGFQGQMLSLLAQD